MSRSSDCYLRPTIISPGTIWDVQMPHVKCVTTAYCISPSNDPIVFDVGGCVWTISYVFRTFGQRGMAGHW